MQTLFAKKQDLISIVIILSYLFSSSSALANNRGLDALNAHLNASTFPLNSAPSSCPDILAQPAPSVISLASQSATTTQTSVNERREKIKALVIEKLSASFHGKFNDLNTDEITKILKEPEKGFWHKSLGLYIKRLFLLSIFFSIAVVPPAIAGYTGTLLKKIIPDIPESTMTSVIVGFSGAVVYLLSGIGAAFYEMWGPPIKKWANSIWGGKHWNLMRAKISDADEIDNALVQQTAQSSTRSLKAAAKKLAKSNNSEAAHHFAHVINRIYLASHTFYLLDPAIISTFREYTFEYLQKISDEEIAEVVSLTALKLCELPEDQWKFGANPSNQLKLKLAINTLLAWLVVPIAKQQEDLAK